MVGVAGTVANETLGYFMVRIMKFLTIVGVDGSRLRFRQVNTDRRSFWDSRFNEKICFLVSYFMTLIVPYIVCRYD
jgi:glycyl-tRNA synthetase (class II)